MRSYDIFGTSEMRSQDALRALGLRSVMPPSQFLFRPMFAVFEESSSC